MANRYLTIGVSLVSFLILVTVLLSVLLTTQESTYLYPISYDIGNNGYIRWKDDRTGKTKLTIESNLLNQNDVLIDPDSTLLTNKLSCNEALVRIKRS